MPIFEYVCGECNHRFELLVYGSTQAACPKCLATKLEKQISAFGVGGTDAWVLPGHEWQNRINLLLERGVPRDFSL